MKINYLFFALLLNFYSVKINAQCNPCPDKFNFTDSINCAHVEASRNCSSIGKGYVGCTTINACKNSQQIYTFTPIGFDVTGTPCVYPAFTYNTVSVTGGFVVNIVNNQITVQWGLANTGSLIIAFSSPIGTSGFCRDTIYLNFNLLNNPVANFVASPQPACFNNPTTINFNSSSSVGAVSYFWKFGDGFTSTLPNPSHAYASPGTYTVCLIVTNNLPPGNTGLNQSCPTCIDSICKQIIIDNLPSPPIECVASVCASATETYCTSATGCASLVWTVTGGVILSGQGTNCITVKWGNGNPQGTINLVATGCVVTYCPQGATVNVPIVPSTFAVVGPSTVCINSSASYALPSWPGNTYNWTLSGGGNIIGNNTNTNQININWNTIGTYNITCNYFDTALNCGGVATITVNVLPILTIVGNNTICQGQNSTLNSLYNSPTTNVNCNWVISPAGATVTSGNGTAFATINWALSNTYTVTATATVAGIVCSNASYTVTVYPSPIISAIVGADSICKNQTKVYAATSNLNGLFTWSITNGSAINLGANNDSVQVSWGAVGPYQLSVSQLSYANNCPSNVFVKNVFAFPTPVITGPTSVCADNIVSYNITNIAVGNFNWYITPASFGTIQSGQGTTTIFIKWHGNNSPGGSNVVYLHFGVCGTDSIAITINEPPTPSITASGTLCAGGVNLNTGATGVFSWVCLEHAISPVQPTNLSTLSGLNLPGHYTVQIQNFNGSGCTVTATYNVPDVGRPIAHISANNSLQYCMPNLPNMTLFENPTGGATYQWYLNGNPIAAATTTTLAVNSAPPVNITSPGTYSFYCVVTLGGCIVASNTITITVLATCTGPGCVGVIKINSIVGCNPFTINISAVSPPSAYIIPGTITILHWLDGSNIVGNVTNTFNTVGYQPIRIYAGVKNNDSSICVAYYDTSVLVKAAANFSLVNNCGVLTLTNLATVISPATISAYSWTVGTNPGNLPTPNGSFNNNAIPNPVLTFIASGSYIISQTITYTGGCTTTKMDTINISIPNANFSINPVCVGTPLAFGNPPSSVDFWDFGDVATSYTSPTLHAWASPGPFTITHIVTNIDGCMDTATQTIIVLPAPTCTIAYGGPTTFCFGDSLKLKGCAGYTNYQWYNNGVPIAAPQGINQNYFANQTGNYSFFAYDVNGCKVTSDTVSITVIQPPSTTTNTSTNRCFGNLFTISVPNCGGCTYVWSVDNVLDPTTNNLFSYFIGTAPLTIGTHTIKVTVTNAFGCFKTDSVVVTFFANPLVNISVVGSPPQLCSNNLYTMIAATNAASPSWVWNYNNIGINLSTTNTLLASSAGSYIVYVTDGITGCTSQASVFIKQSPQLNLFPAGCDTLCDTAHLFLPLGSIFGNLAGYTINWFNNAPPYTPIIGTGTSFNLNTLPLGNHNLSVIVIAPNGCADTSNVYSVFTKNCSAVLAIKDINLAVIQQGNYAILNWKTTGEFNNDFFIVESSIDGLQFNAVSKILSKGDNVASQYYSYKDIIPLNSSLIYYRIKMVDKNGAYQYSNIEKLQIKASDYEKILVYPNIVFNNATVEIQSESYMNTNLIVYSLEGKQVLKTTIHLIKGINNLPLQTINLAAGLYYINVVTGKNILTTSFIKQ